MSLETLMTGLEVRLETIAGLRVRDVRPDQVNPPQAFIGVPPVDDYRQAYGRGKYEVAPTITVLTSRALDRVGQTQLARFAALSGAESIPAAVAGDRTLGGAVEDIEIVSFRPLTPEEVGLVTYFGGVFVCRALITEGPPA